MMKNWFAMGNLTAPLQQPTPCRSFCKTCCAWAAWILKVTVRAAEPFGRRSGRAEAEVFADLDGKDKEICWPAAERC